jgi:hypothetical protein
MSDNLNLNIKTNVLKDVLSISSNFIYLLFLLIKFKWLNQNIKIQKNLSLIAYLIHNLIQH